MMPLLEGIGVYFLLCLVTILSGRGISRLVGIRLEDRIALYLAPLLTQVFWIVILGWGVSLGFPVSRVALPVWVLSILLAVFGLWSNPLPLRKHDFPIFLTVILLPLALTAPFFWHGFLIYMGSWLPDGWSYVAYGQYIWKYPRGTEGNLAPLYQYAAHLNGTRFIASALLGFFSLLTGHSGEVHTSIGIFWAWSFFVFSCACSFLTQTLKLSSPFVLLYSGLCVFSGWHLNLLWANNYDNAVALSFLPAWAGIVRITEPKNRRWVLIWAIFGAGTLFTYPEMAPFILGGTLLFFSQRLFEERKKEWFLFISLSSALIILGLLPFLRDFFSFLQAQLKSSLQNPGIRPGEDYFPELLSPKYGLLAFWGFRMGSTGGSILHSFLALISTIFSIMGVAVLIKKKQWGLLLTIFLLLAAALIMLGIFRYPYGTYKLILLNWWGMCLLTILGISFLIQRYSYGWVKLGVAIFFLLIFGVQGFTINSRSDSRTNILPYKQAEKVKDLTHGAPVIVAVDDGLANEWVVYFLRDIPIYLAEYKVYMAQPHVVPLMERSMPVNLSSVQFILSDRLGLFSFPAQKAQWSGGPYYLWRLHDRNWILLSRIRNPNGLEIWQGQPGFWLGGGDTEIRLLSPRDGKAILRGFFTRGPSIPALKERALMIQSDQGYSRNINLSKDGFYAFHFPVIPGWNRLILRPLDRPSLSVLPGGDHRPLLIGVRGLEVRMTTSGAPG